MKHLPLIATLLVAAASGALAAAATSSQAVATGAITNHYLALLLPVILEGGACTAAVLAFQRSGAGLGAWPERLTLITLAVLTTVVNATHASGGSMLGAVLAACPPLILVTSLELLFRAKATGAQTASKPVIAPTLASTPLAVPASAHTADTEPHTRPVPAAADSLGLPEASSPQNGSESPAQSVAPTAAPGTETVTAPKAKVKPAAHDLEARLAVIDEMLAAGEVCNGSTLSERLGLSSATARRLLAAHRERTAVA